MGFGRIGRNLFRLLEDNDGPEIGVIADINDPEALAYLLKYDSIYGRFSKSVELDGSTLVVEDARIPIVDAREPGDLTWSDFGVSTVVQATGKYRTRAWCEKHLEQGARRVILASTPEEPTDLPILLKGVNDEILDDDPEIIAMGSNTSNAFAPVIDVLESTFGIERMFFTTVHAYTNRERLADVPSEGFRTSRAAGENIIPAETNSPEILLQVFPGLAGRLSASALNVPVENGSTIDAVTVFRSPVTVESLNGAIKDAAANKYSGILEYQVDPIVSTDVWGTRYSGIFDSLATMVMGDTMAKTIVWFDNGWGYSVRILETLNQIGAMEGSQA
jgi:glyceraldehyde 3-phosphate dehydrogenase